MAQPETEVYPETEGWQEAITLHSVWVKHAWVCMLKIGANKFKFLDFTTFQLFNPSYPKDYHLKMTFDIPDNLGNSGVKVVIVCLLKCMHNSQIQW